MHEIIFNPLQVPKIIFEDPNPWTLPIGNRCSFSGLCDNPPAARCILGGSPNSMATPGPPRTARRPNESNLTGECTEGNQRHRGGGIAEPKKNPKVINLSLPLGPKLKESWIQQFYYFSLLLSIYDHGW